MHHELNLVNIRSKIKWTLQHPLTTTIFMSYADSDASSNLVTFYNYALAFNPAKAKLALEESHIKVMLTSIGSPDIS